MMTNKNRIEKKLSELGYKMGTCSMLIESLNHKQLRKVIDQIEYGSGDIDLKIEGKQFVVEVYHVDDEIDFNIISKKDYVNRYGNERYSNDH